ncbi:MAG: hypothetical protein HYR56_29180 [Acidobacteria bacterium]|nr:hypothetical protein [Acidobacteriota bacterium]MBI3425316.1 hypothetical protein [Acidobacteriota bacterium]
MYSVDEKDRVVPITDIPQSSVGAPTPIVLSSEGVTVVAFYLQDTPPGWDGTTIGGVTESIEDEPLALVKFSRCYSSMFGPPNDEAFHGHPLASRGLTPYGAFVIEISSWIRQLERMNSVHWRHDPDRFWTRKHYVLSFHDSTFECVADGYTVEVHESSLNQMLTRMAELLTGSSAKRLS